MNLQDENDLDWQVMASNWSRLVFCNLFYFVAFSLSSLVVLISLTFIFFFSQVSVPLSGSEANGGLWKNMYLIVIWGHLKVFISHSNCLFFPTSEATIRQRAGLHSRPLSSPNWRVVCKGQTSQNSTRLKSSRGRGNARRGALIIIQKFSAAFTSNGKLQLALSRFT